MRDQWAVILELICLVILCGIGCYCVMFLIERAIEHVNGLATNV
jgi:hypothetical protein